jgi:hypothetical protein
MTAFLQNLKRCSVELAIVITVGLILRLTPESYLDPGNINPKIAVLATFLLKAVYTSMGFLSGHIARKVMLPYIDFRAEKDWSNNAIVIAFYILGVYAWVNAG